MFKKTLTTTVAAFTLASATLTIPSSAQAGVLGKVVAGVAGVVIGAAAVGAAARAASDDDAGYRPAYRAVRGGYDNGCGFRLRPVFDEYGNRAGMQRVPTC